MAANLSGYTALITGGSSGMGFEMAKQLLSQGATVIIAARGGSKLDNARTKLAQGGADVHAIPMDVTSEQSIADAAQQVGEAFDHLDMLVCNAGIGGNAPGMQDLPPNHHFYDIPLGAVKAVIDTNLVGYFAVASKFVPLMLQNGRGSLVYVSTSDATMTRPGQLPYGPSKAGAEAMSTIIANELRDLGIMVNVICPGGFTDTPMAPPGAKEFFEQNGMPVLPPWIMNKTISFLASPASAGISGEKIVAKDIDSWLAQRGIEFDY